MGKRLVDTFKENFKDKTESIIIYGTGNGARAIIEECKEFNFAAVMDRDKTDGEYLGLPIVSFDNICNTDVKKIVIVAVPANVGIIYRRIESESIRLGIDVYNVNGENLSNIYNENRIDIPYFKKNNDELERKIEEFDILSFDIFDTLLVRRVMNPIDVLQIVSDRIKNTNYYIADFKGVRLKALEQAVSKYVEPNIDEIYEEVQAITGLENSDIKKIKQLEINIEEDIIEPRKAVVDIFDKYKESKKIYLISNMYLCHDILEGILHKNGISGYEKLFVSCDYRVNKSNGLFDIVVQEMNHKPENILHIGDNISMDVESAEKCGYKTYYIMNKVDMLKNSTLMDLDKYNENLLTSSIIASVTNALFDDPFALYNTYGKIYINNLDTYVKAILSPCAIAYATWVGKNILDKQMERVLCTARDGYLIQKIIEVFEESKNRFPQIDYFYTSRRSILAATASCNDNYMDIASRTFTGSLGQLFDVRFNVVIDEELYDREINRDNIIEVLNLYSNEIEAYCSSQNRNYNLYLDSLNFRAVEKIAVVEQIGIGSVQYGIERLLPNADVEGLYLKKLADKNDLKYASFYPVKEGYDSLDHLRLSYLVFEQFLSSYEPSVKAFSDDGKPVFEIESRSMEQIDILKNMHNITLAEARVINKVIEDITSYEIIWKLVDQIIYQLDDSITTIDVLELNNMSVEDNFGTASTVRVQ